MRLIDADILYRDITQERDPEFHSLMNSLPDDQRSLIMAMLLRLIMNRPILDTCSGETYKAKTPLIFMLKKRFSKDD